MPLETASGVPLPLGAQQRDGGVNFAVFSRHATAVSLLLFDHPDDAQPTCSMALEPLRHRSGDIWHVWVGGLGPGCLYAWQVDGPDAPQEGDRFNPRLALLDPYATALVGTERWDFAQAHGDRPEPQAVHAKCLLPDDGFDWQDDQPPRHPWSATVIYETHVRGLSMYPSAAVRYPGTYLGVADMIPYFRKLGITAVELLPVQEFHEYDVAQTNPLSGERLRDYWGYNTVAFFAPKESYSSRSATGCQIAEFKTMVRELHRAGIELILDIVFNHTAEGDQRGPTLNFRGLDNRIYYLLENDRRYYKNFSGTGNTLNCNHPVVRDYILDCLRHWVVEMHVDGFRFDLAAIMERDEDGNILPNPPLLERIAEDPILRDVKLIAEAWDAAGVYQVGRFPGRRWSEWNGRYRDEVRRFWRGDAGMTGLLASRLCGSADLYQQSDKEPLNSINYLTCHDGFTLNDVVSYAAKHNAANGHDNHDGSDENYSANYGVEGPSDDPVIERLRKRQIKNMLATLMLSRGVPMLLGGDEFRRSQSGNNNAYCQDNEVSWYDWRLLETESEIYEFTRAVIDLRRRFPLLAEERFYAAADVSWFGLDGAPPDWGAPARTLGCHLHPPGYTDELCLLFNAEQHEVLFSLPQARNGKKWQRECDSSDDRENSGGNVASCRLQSRSLVIFSA